MVALEKEKEWGKLKGKKDEIIPTKKKELELTLNTNFVVGLDSPKTMKFVGDIKEKQMVILLDNGITHNFISRKLVEKLGLCKGCFCI